MERKLWSEDQDRSLLAIIEETTPGNWAETARALFLRSGVRRTGKQCRERWHNQLSPEIKKGRWTPEEQRLMRCVLKEQGTHWANIRKMLKGRSDNCVKNHYYSTVRKTLRWVYREVEAARKNDPLLAGFHSEVALLIQKPHFGPDKDIVEGSQELRNQLYCLGVAKQLDEITESEFRERATSFCGVANLIGRRAEQLREFRRRQVSESDEEEQFNPDRPRQASKRRKAKPETYQRKPYNEPQRNNVQTSGHNPKEVKVETQDAECRKKVEKKTSFGEDIEKRQKRRRQQKQRQKQKQQKQRQKQKEKERQMQKQLQKERQQKREEPEQEGRGKEGEKEFLMPLLSQLPSSYSYLSYIGSPSQSSFASQIFITSGLMIPYPLAPGE